jgi:glyoxylase-like metal-dependent hydrolase (beta-lactamase superfamily II)
VTIAAAAAAGIHCLPIPTPFAVGRVNCYLIDDEPLTLVDTGPNSGKALDELERALHEHGRHIEDLERIVITHQHIDHLGLVDILARRSGAEVCALDLLAPVIEAFGADAERDDELAERLMLRHGIPRDVVTALRAVSRSFRGWGGWPTVRSWRSATARCGSCTALATRRRTRCSGTSSGRSCSPATT